MAYSAQTTHYGLPLPTGSDKSSFLDTNESFTVVDTALYAAVTGQAEVETEVQNLNAEILTMQSGITDINTAIGGLQNGLASTNLLVQEHADDITALESGKQDKTDNNLVTTDKTIVGAINELAGAGPGTVDADDVTYDNTTSGLTATNVQDAIDEIVSGGGVNADDVSYDNTTSGLTATNVQDAVDELAANMVGVATQTMTGTLPTATTQTITQKLFDWPTGFSYDNCFVSNAIAEDGTTIYPLVYGNSANNNETKYYFQSDGFYLSMDRYSPLSAKPFSVTLTKIGQPV